MVIARPRGIPLFLHSASDTRAKAHTKGKKGEALKKAQNQRNDRRGKQSKSGEGDLHFLRVNTHLLIGRGFVLLRSLWYYIV